MTSRRRRILCLFILLAATFVYSRRFFGNAFIRRLIFRGLRSKWPFWAAALTSACFFAVAHWPGSGWGIASPILVFEILCGGLAAAYAYEKSGSLLAPVTLHVLWNTMQEFAHTSQYL